MDEFAIRVSQLSKDFVLPHERTNSIKSAFTGLVRRSGRRQKETQHALRDISFEIKSGEFFGIVGRNGSGKSTLLKILAGIYQPTKGSVQTCGKLVPFIELGVGFNPELTGRENVYLNGAMLGFSIKEIDAMYDDIVAFAELERFMDQKLKNYSSGMQVRLAFSMATRSEADILLIDEVLAVGDADFQRKCYDYFKKLKKSDTTVIFVSHDMSAVREFCDRALLIDDSEIVMMGETDQVAQRYSELFLQTNDATTTQTDHDTRWGDGSVRMVRAAAEVGDKEVTVTAEVKVHQPVDQIIYGIHIVAADGQEVTAMNNRMINAPNITQPVAGDLFKVEWNMLNIFNDGRYTVMLTFIDTRGNTLDWHTEACSFIVKRAERSTTSVLPPVRVQIKPVARKSNK